ncbi:MAG TPA: hypothetical protein VMS71_00640 [Candidatus Acidoferrum sp.]|nr:hypothetical protein [Candidatus Acidoferrum sp.]
MTKQTYTQLLLLLPLLLILSCSRGSQSFDKLKAQGQKAFVASDYKEAREYFIKALAIKPSDRDVLYLTGLCYKRDYVYDSALSYLRRADLLYPGDKEINMEIYEAAVATKSWEFAARAVNSLIAAGEPLDKYLDVLVRINLEMDEPLQVAYYLRKGVALKPDDPTYYLQLTNALVTCESLSAAVEVADEAIKRFGPKNEFIANRANLSAYQGDYATAEKQFRSLIVSDTSRATDYKLNLANVLSMQSKDKAKIREALDLYREIRPKVDSRYKVDSLIGVLEEQLKK